MVASRLGLRPTPYGGRGGLTPIAPCTGEGSARITETHTMPGKKRVRQAKAVANPRSTYSIPPEEKGLLEQMAERTGMSRSAIVTKLIGDAARYMGLRVEDNAPEFKRSLQR